MLKVILLIVVLLAAAASQAAEMNLDAAIDFALTGSPSAVAAEATYLSARADLWQGWGGVLPSASASYAGYRYYDREAVTIGGFQIPGYQPPTHDYTASLRATQPLFAGGALIWGVMAGRASARAGAASRDEQKQRLVVAVVQAYAAVLKADGLKRVADTSLEVSRRAEELARVQHETGAIPRAEYLKAKVALGQAETAAIQAEAAAATSRIAFFNTLGMKPDPDAAFAEVTSPAREELPPLAELIDDAYAHRPDVTRIGAEKRKADLAVKSAAAGWWPTIGAAASYDWTDSEAPTRENWDPNAYWTVGISGSLNLFDGFNTAANTARARAAASSARAAHERLRDTVALDVTQAYYEYRKQAETVNVAEETAAAAEEEFNIQQRLYALGGASMLELTNAQAHYVEANNAYINARYDFLVAAYDLKRALGVTGR